MSRGGPARPTPARLRELASAAEALAGQINDVLHTALRADDDGHRRGARFRL